MAVYFTNYMEQ